MALILLLLLSLPLFLLFLLPKYYYIRERKKLRPPGPRGLPFIGNLHQLNSTTTTTHRSLWQLSQKHGPLMSLRLGSTPTLVVSSAKMAKEVMKTHDLAFCSRPPLLGLRKLSYNGIDIAFSPYDDHWRELRKISALYLFSIKRVLSFRPIREDEVSKTIRKIFQLSSSSKIINLSEIMMGLTSSIICRVAFGKRYEDEGCERSRFYGMLIEAQAVMGSFYFSDHFPIMGWVDKLTGLYGRLENNFKEMDTFFQEIIDDHLNPKRPKSMGEDIADILLQLKRDQLCPFDLTLNHIKAVIKNILVGGTDTTAAAIEWTMAMLMKNPRVMKRVQEIRSSIGKKDIVDEDDIQKLQYLKAVIKESMRLNPPLPLLAPRETIQSSIIDGYEIPPKTLVYVNAWAIGRDSESWDNPEEFYPERFIGNEIDFRGNDFELIPFGAGRRGCPGLNLGTSTVELILANLLYLFDWNLPAGMKKEDIDSEETPGIVMHRKNPLCLVAKSNNQEQGT